MNTGHYKTELCKIEDYHQIIRDIVDFWDSERTLFLHHPFLIYEFGNTAFVIKENDMVIAYLFGFFSQTESVGYVHLLGVRDNYRRKGLGTLLYNNFIELSKSKGIKKIKAITTPTNEKSIQFHKKQIGMTLIGNPNQDGINVVKNYSGINQDRVVFEKEI